MMTPRSEIFTVKENLVEQRAAFMILQIYEKPFK